MAPGRESSVIRTYKDNKGRVFADGQSGIISCIDTNSGVILAGSYSGSVGLYDMNSGTLLCTMSHHKAGVTQVKYAASGRYIVTAARKDDRILVYDSRNTTQTLHSLERKCTTNQHILFDLDPSGRFLFTGCEV